MCDRHWVAVITEPPTATYLMPVRHGRACAATVTCS
jgi:hypothetical protein